MLLIQQFLYSNIFHSQGSKIAKFNDQNSTDFEKCLKLISKHEKLTAEQFDVIYVLGIYVLNFMLFFPNSFNPFMFQDTIKWNNI